MSASDYGIAPSALRERVEHLSRSDTRRAVLALTIGCIIALNALTAAGVESRMLSDAIGGVLAGAFIALAAFDFRASVAVMIFELVLGGAGGHWIDYHGLSGRIFLISVVTARAAQMTIVDWRHGLRPVLGRYGAHALAIAFLMPAIWMPLGLVDGNLRGNVVADGDGFVFFAVVLVVVTLLRRGEGAWLEKSFFAACAASGAAYFLLIAVTASGAVSLETVRVWLSVRLAMGGVIGYMPNGEYRLFTAGSLLLVVGLVLTTDRLLARPRDIRLWVLGSVFCVDLVATYTRGLWLAAFVGVALVVALGVRSIRQLGFILAIPAAVVGLALAVAPLVGFSLDGYVSARAASIVAASNTKYYKHVKNPGFEASSGGWGVSSRSLGVLRTVSAARAGRHSLELSNSRAGQDAYVFQNLAVQPDTEYSLTAWVDARAFRRPAAGGRGLLVWDAQDGLLYTVPLTNRTHGWKRLSLSFQTQANAKDIQLRLYAPQGRVLWDAVRLRARGAARAVTSATPAVPVTHSTLPSSRAAVLDASFERTGVWQVSATSSRSLRVLRTASAARAGRHSLELSNPRAGQDAYVFQNLAVQPDTEYSLTAWVNARALRRPAAGGRGLLVWDAQDGLLYTVPLTNRTHGWKRLSLSFQTQANAKDIQLRLYAPESRVLWDFVHLGVGGPVQLTSVPASPAAASMAIAATGENVNSVDAAGAASNSYRIAEAKALLRYIRKSPIYGYGFGSVASTFSATGYSYELSYLDLLFKTGILGLLLFLSFPLTLVIDAWRIRRRRTRAMPDGARAMGRPEVVVGVVAGILVAGATNPYLFAAFGLLPLLVMVAWLDHRHAVGPLTRSG